ncbi:MAG TPA: ABC transporter permease, partial [Pyrinomonadaceae bacterium]|nr:ABC transporter permease [Pyrinomonadaceae bacterium]
MDTIFKDIRYAIRSLLKRPAFAAVAVITLALGIGANTAIFSIINALVINPPSIADPDRVAALWKTPIGKREENFVSYLDWQDWRTRNQSLEDIAAYKPNSFTLLENGEAEEIQGMRVTANFFSVPKIKPLRGREFTGEEEKRGSQPVTIISYEYWQSRFAGSESVLNQQISLNGKSHTIVAILPPGFEFPLSVKDPLVWTTVAGEGSNLAERGAQVLKAVGRLKPDVSIESAQADMSRVAVNLAQQYPQTDRDQTITLISAHEQIVGKDIRRALWLLLGA